MTTPEARERGHWTHQLTVWCGGCVEWLQVDTGIRREAINDVRRQGWRYTSLRGWICPTCRGKGPIHHGDPPP